MLKPLQEDLLVKWQEKITSLKEDTQKIAAEELKQAEEIEKVMKTSTGSLYLTYGIIVVNVLVFVAMVIKGVDIMSPTGEDIVNWGGNYLPFTIGGDWWRLISCVFVHIGIIHLLFNMYALYSIGTYLEPMLGRVNYITAYLCTGVLASLASLWWHKTPSCQCWSFGGNLWNVWCFLSIAQHQFDS